jgi:hypothetical protein
MPAPIKYYLGDSKHAEGIHIANEQMLGASHINKFGYTGTAVNGSATIWDGSGTSATYTYLTAPVTLRVESDEENDDGATYLIEGLDGDYNPVSEEITTSPTGGATGGVGTGTQLFLRVFRARMISNGGVNEGNVSINANETAPNNTLLAYIKEDNGQTLMSIYTVPAGKTAYLFKLHGSVDKANVDVKFMFFETPFGGSKNIKHMSGTQGGNPIDYDYPVPLRFEEKSDLEMRITTSASCGAGGIFDLILVDNPE